MQTLALPQVRDRKSMKFRDTLPHFKQFRRTFDRVKESTLTRDMSSLHAFGACVGNIAASYITMEHVEHFFAQRAKPAGASGKRTAGKCGPSAQNSDLRALRVWFKWAHAKSIRTGENPVAMIKAWTIPDQDRHYITADQFGPLLDAAERRNPRDRMVCALSLYLWQRQSEPRHLRWGDLSPDHGVQGGTLSVVVPKTGQLDPEMPISRELYREIYGHHDENGQWTTGWEQCYKENLGIQEINPDWYFIPQMEQGRFRVVGADGKQDRYPARLLPLVQLNNSLDAVRFALEAIGEYVTENVTHVLRRSGAREYYYLQLAAGRGQEEVIRDIMAMLHHTSMSTTERYLGVERDRQRRNMRIQGKDMYGNLSVVSAAPAAGKIVDLAAFRRAK